MRFRSHNNNTSRVWYATVATVTDASVTTANITTEVTASTATANAAAASHTATIAAKVQFCGAKRYRKTYIYGEECLREEHRK